MHCICPYKISQSNMHVKLKMSHNLFTTPFTTGKKYHGKTFGMVYVHNGNWTVRSAIWSEIMRVISKSNERTVRVRFEITSMISDQNCTPLSSITTFIKSILKSHSFIVLNFRFWCIVPSRAILLKIAEPEMLWHII